MIRSGSSVPSAVSIARWIDNGDSTVIRPAEMMTSPPLRPEL
jgi:hypothetical protein